ncbi:citrate synthase [Flaviflexus equikiangi]|uniref:Citrate synthase n=1 Tax=Flaviflexus equikiangi TaxID=2758573 RepID=A0ABS2TBW9_9ACTO|nr:citrate synthase [Flaviflexus equikiangi]MBM9432144.1 citrate synthase [Flaviflexus equikiangi]
MSETAKLILDGKEYEFPVITGTMGEKSIDISKLRSTTGYITLDDGYSNTGSCQSDVTFIDGEKGILRYRGYPIEQIAQNSSFIEAAYLVIFGKLCNQQERDDFADLLSENAPLHQSMLKHFDGYGSNGQPMAILSAMVNSLTAYDPQVMHPEDENDLVYAAASLISKVRTIAAASHKTTIGEPIIYPRKDLKYVENFLHMMFSTPYSEYEPTPEVVRALNMFLVLHADHEQNCSTSTVRMVASSKANMFASASAGISALWGRLHGGANVAVIEMLQKIHDEGVDPSVFMNEVKDKESGRKLMGFGHRVYKNFDPRATILKDAAFDMLEKMNIEDPLLDVALKLEEVALQDDYFVERKLYPNVDFYSGIILRAIGIPLDMFTVMFAIGRMPGWIANWKEVHEDPKARIYRPRQVYQGEVDKLWVPRDQR